MIAMLSFVISIFWSFATTVRFYLKKKKKIDTELLNLLQTNKNTLCIQVRTFHKQKQCITFRPHFPEKIHGVLILESWVSYFASVTFTINITTIFSSKRKQRCPLPSSQCHSNYRSRFLTDLGNCIHLGQFFSRWAFSLFSLKNVGEEIWVN